VASAARAHLARLNAAEALVARLETYPERSTAYAMARHASAQALEDMIEGIDQGLARHAAKTASGASLQRLAAWMSDKWIAAAWDAIQRGDPTYRELIQFSNASFYANRLSVPARHPPDEVRRQRPIELIRVDGVYEEQTNREEADRVADVLMDIWTEGGSSPPTVGVVTFNRKQADLIENVLGVQSCLLSSTPD
jgi:hypothetical protein